MKKIILFNGPPKSGKDFGAEYVKNNFRNAILNKFAKVLKERTHALYGFHWRAHDYYEDCKNDSNKDFLGLSPRQAYINVSETYFKPVHGENVFGSILSNELDKLEWDIAVISDSGFTSEAQVLINKYGKNNVTLIRVYRDGCDFSKDSRSYIELPVTTLNLRNNGDESYTFAIHKIVENLIKDLDVKKFNTQSFIDIPNIEKVNNLDSTKNKRDFILEDIVKDRNNLTLSKVKSWFQKQIKGV